MIVRFILWTSLAVLIANCDKIKSLSTENMVTSYDTIKSPVGSSLFKYKNHDGIAISEFYYLKDSLALDLNSDNRNDLLLLLSPIVFEDPDFYRYRDSLGIQPETILVEVLNISQGRRLRNTYKNLTSNIPGVLSKYAGMSLTSRGFQIAHESGNRYSWTFSTNFSTTLPDSIYLVGIEKKCSLEQFDSTITLSFNDKSVRTLSVNDTINNDCNCDRIWESLESRLNPDEGN